ncbi:hypothetical protein DUNSADRAFT_1921 [Dunaliella salina]|uniref:Uncharacterized protein n=1 Tax=Dunaliella salina TaxID=3046 RepID=A0ABQ7FX21_DUNSA|nr:hypothetical protein DUNSADRAFT_1921 [Dunaliella salina]|eukprot:KAF5826842.1 hypothetical protein DUNSADRAFT_1921 [Dunaliella salina]
MLQPSLVQLAKTFLSCSHPLLTSQQLLLGWPSYPHKKLSSLPLISSTKAPSLRQWTRQRMRMPKCRPMPETDTCVHHT